MNVEGEVRRGDPKSPTWETRDRRVAFSRYKEILYALLFGDKNALPLFLWALPDPSRATDAARSSAVGARGLLVTSHLRRKHELKIWLAENAGA